jgi:hypothetical protein
MGHSTAVTSHCYYAMRNNAQGRISVKRRRLHNGSAGPYIPTASAETSCHLLVSTCGFQAASSRLCVVSCVLQLTTESLEKTQEPHLVYQYNAFWLFAYWHSAFQLHVSNTVPFSCLSTGTSFSCLYTVIAPFSCLSLTAACLLG